MDIDEINNKFFVGQRFVDLLLADNVHLRELILKARDMEELSTSLGSSGQQFNYTLGANQKGSHHAESHKESGWGLLPERGTRS